MQKISFIKRSFMVILAMLSLSSCASYSTQYLCPDSDGIPCEMLGIVDKKITSGEIKNTRNIQYKSSAKCGCKKYKRAKI